MCIVPKHQTAELDCSNAAMSSNIAKIIIACDYTRLSSSIRSAVA